jgi:carbon-monoxide dehydrogenase catalytic subunit
MRILSTAAYVGLRSWVTTAVETDYTHVELVKELIRNDVLVLQTGCSQLALTKAGLTGPGAAAMAGPGLAEVCETVGMPPILGLGSCVDNSRILVAASEMVRTGGLGDCIAEPGCRLRAEWMSERPSPRHIS